MTLIGYTMMCEHDAAAALSDPPPQTDRYLVAGVCE